MASSAAPTVVTPDRPALDNSALDNPAPKKAHPGLLPIATLLLLLWTVMVPFVTGSPLLVTATGVGALSVAAAAWLVERATPTTRPVITSSRRRGVGRVTPPWAGPVWGPVEMALVLSPVLLLTFIFPVAVARMGTVEIGGVPLTTLLLASSLTVPWLSVAVCLPLYRAIGDLIPVREVSEVRVRFAEVWPKTFLQVTPTVLLFAVPIGLLLHWSLTAGLTYVVLCLLHAAFAQSLVLANISRDRLLWAAAWVGYAAALFVFPSHWYLPPLVGLLTQLVPFRSVVHQVRRTVTLDYRDVALDLGRGLLLGSVLWAHLLLLFLKSDAVFDVTVVFLAVLPAVLAYNYYFVRLAPEFDRAVLVLRWDMENETQTTTSRSSSALSETVTRSISRTGFVGAGLTAAVASVTYAVNPGAIARVSAVALASWLFLMTTLLCYKLDYIGQRRKAQAFSAAHLVLAGLIFLLVPSGPDVYGWLVVGELLIFAAALREALTQWRTSEFALFWRHATAW
jgi:hypothetical protein